MTIEEYSMLGGRMTVPGRSIVIGRGEFRCMDCGTEWSAIGSDVGSCDVCLTPQLHRLHRKRIFSIRVLVKPDFRSRTRIMTWLMRLFARVFDCGIEFVEIEL